MSSPKRMIEKLEKKMAVLERMTEAQRAKEQLRIKQEQKNR